MTRPTISTVLAELGGWAALLLLSYWWLAIPEAAVWQLLGAALLALFMLALLTYLVTLAFTAGERRWAAALRRVPRISPAVLLWGAATYCALRYIDKEWLLAPALAGLLIIFGPLFAAGFAGFRRLRRTAVWIALALFALAGLYLPWRLMWWAPLHGSLSAEVASAIVRFGAAGLLFAATWLLVGGAFSKPDPQP